MRQKEPFSHPSAQPKRTDRATFRVNGYEIEFGNEKQGIRTLYWARAEVEDKTISVSEVTFRGCIAKVRTRLATLPKGTFIDRNV
jgi:hypothetical protein